MAYEKKEGDFTLFKVEDKKSEKHPDYTGSIFIGGKDYYLDAWKKVGKESGKPFLSGKIGAEKKAKGDF